MEANGDRMCPGGLDGVLQLDPPAIHRVTLAAESIRNVLRRDGAEPLALLPRLLRLVPGGADPGLSGDALLVPLGGLVCQTLRQEIVASIAGLDSHHLTGPAERLDILPQYHFDHGSTLRWPTP